MYYAFIFLKFSWMSSEEKKRGRGRGKGRGGGKGEKTKKIPWKINSRGKVGSRRIIYPKLLNPNVN